MRRVLATRVRGAIARGAIRAPAACDARSRETGVAPSESRDVARDARARPRARIAARARTRRARARVVDVVAASACAWALTRRARERDDARANDAPSDAFCARARDPMVCAHGGEVLRGGDGQREDGAGARGASGTRVRGDRRAAHERWRAGGAARARCEAVRARGHRSGGRGEPGGVGDVERGRRGGARFRGGARRRGDARNSHKSQWISRKTRR